METNSTLTDSSVLERFGSRLAAVRLSRNLTQADLAKEAGVSRNTLDRIERGMNVESKLLMRVLRSLNLLDAVFESLPDDEPSPMELLKARGHKRRRARRVVEKTGGLARPKGIA